MEYDILSLIGSLIASGVFFTFAVATYLIQAVTIYKLAEKANVENRWLAFIPGLQMILFLTISGKSGWLFLLYLVPFVNFFFGIFVIARLLQAFDRPMWLVICSILIPFVFQITLIYMAFSDDVDYVLDRDYDFV